MRSSYRKANSAQCGDGASCPSLKGGPAGTQRQENTPSLPGITCLHPGVEKVSHKLDLHICITFGCSLERSAAGSGAKLGCVLARKIPCVKHSLVTVIERKII